jgi:hypothetical protein
VVAAPPVSVGGVLTCGPYLPGANGRFNVTFRYSAEVPASIVVGSADVANVSDVQAALRAAGCHRPVRNGRAIW